ncbi:MAG: hypothetical protein M1823_008280, partial [Watsoniomyces obsoletus]
MNARALDGQLSARDHLLHRPLVVETQDDMNSCVNSGGAGCFAKPREYCQILAALLNDGRSPTTGAQILQKATVDTMFQAARVVGETIREVRRNEKEVSEDNPGLVNG